jgi:hypothetical protein
MHSQLHRGTSQDRSLLDISALCQSQQQLNECPSHLEIVKLICGQCGQVPKSLPFYTLAVHRGLCECNCAFILPGEFSDLLHLCPARSRHGSRSVVRRSVPNQLNSQT